MASALVGAASARLRASLRLHLGEAMQRGDWVRCLQTLQHCRESGTPLHALPYSAVLAFLTTHGQWMQTLQLATAMVCAEAGVAADGARPAQLAAEGLMEGVDDRRNGVVEAADAALDETRLHDYVSADPALLMALVKLSLGSPAAAPCEELPKAGADASGAPDSSTTSGSWLAALQLLLAAHHRRQQLPDDILHAAQRATEAWIAECRDRLAPRSSTVPSSDSAAAYALELERHRALRVVSSLLAAERELRGPLLRVGAPPTGDGEARRGARTGLNDAERCVRQVEEDEEEPYHQSIIALLSQAARGERDAYRDRSFHAELASRVDAGLTEAFGSTVKTVEACLRTSAADEPQRDSRTGAHQFTLRSGSDYSVNVGALLRMIQGQSEVRHVLGSVAASVLIDHVQRRSSTPDLSYGKRSGAVGQKADASSAFASAVSEAAWTGVSLILIRSVAATGTEHVRGEAARVSRSTATGPPQDGADAVVVGQHSPPRSPLLDPVVAWSTLEAFAAVCDSRHRSQARRALCSSGTHGSAALAAVHSEMLRSTHCIALLAASAIATQHTDSSGSSGVAVSSSEKTAPYPARAVSLLCEAIQRYMEIVRARAECCCDGGGDRAAEDSERQMNSVLVAGRRDLLHTLFSTISPVACPRSVDAEFRAVAAHLLRCAILEPLEGQRNALAALFPIVVRHNGQSDAMGGGRYRRRRRRKGSSSTATTPAPHGSRTPATSESCSAGPQPYAAVPSEAAPRIPYSVAQPEALADIACIILRLARHEPAQHAARPPSVRSPVGADDFSDGVGNVSTLLRTRANDLESVYAHLVVPAALTCNTSCSVTAEPFLQSEASELVPVAKAVHLFLSSMRCEDAERVASVAAEGLVSAMECLLPEHCCSPLDSGTPRPAPAVFATQLATLIGLWGRVHGGDGGTDDPRHLYVGCCERCVALFICAPRSVDAVLLAYLRYTSSTVTAEARAQLLQRHFHVQGFIRQRLSVTLVHEVPHPKVAPSSPSSLDATATVVALPPRQSCRSPERTSATASLEAAQSAALNEDAELYQRIAPSVARAVLISYSLVACPSRSTPAGLPPQLHTMVQRFPSPADTAVFLASAAHGSLVSDAMTAVKTLGSTRSSAAAPNSGADAAQLSPKWARQRGLDHVRLTTLAVVMRTLLTSEPSPRRRDAKKLLARFDRRSRGSASGGSPCRRPEGVMGKAMGEFGSSTGPPSDSLHLDPLARAIISESERDELVTNLERLRDSGQWGRAIDLFFDVTSSRRVSLHDVRAFTWVFRKASPAVIAEILKKILSLVRELDRDAGHSATSGESMAKEPTTTPANGCSAACDGVGVTDHAEHVAASDRRKTVWEVSRRSQHIISMDALAALEQKAKYVYTHFRYDAEYRRRHAVKKATVPQIPDDTSFVGSYRPHRLVTQYPRLVEELIQVKLAAFHALQLLPRPVSLSTLDAEIVPLVQGICADGTAKRSQRVRSLPTESGVAGAQPMLLPSSYDSRFEVNDLLKHSGLLFMANDVPSVPTRTGPCNAGGEEEQRQRWDATQNLRRTMSICREIGDVRAAYDAYLTFCEQYAGTMLPPQLMLQLIQLIASQEDVRDMDNGDRRIPSAVPVFAPMRRLATTCATGHVPLSVLKDLVLNALQSHYTRPNANVVEGAGPDALQGSSEGDLFVRKVLLAALHLHEVRGGDDDAGAVPTSSPWLLAVAQSRVGDSLRCKAGVALLHQAEAVLQSALLVIEDSPTQLLREAPWLLQATLAVLCRIADVALDVRSSERAPQEIWWQDAKPHTPVDVSCRRFVRRLMQAVERLERHVPGSTDPAIRLWLRFVQRQYLRIFPPPPLSDNAAQDPPPLGQKVWIALYNEAAALARSHATLTTSGATSASDTEMQELVQHVRTLTMSRLEAETLHVALFLHRLHPHHPSVRRGVIEYCAAVLTSSPLSLCATGRDAAGPPEAAAGVIFLGVVEVVARRARESLAHALPAAYDAPASSFNSAEVEPARFAAVGAAQLDCISLGTIVCTVLSSLRGIVQLAVAESATNGVPLPPASPGTELAQWGVHAVCMLSAAVCGAIGRSPSLFLGDWKMTSATTTHLTPPLSRALEYVWKAHGRSGSRLSSSSGLALPFAESVTPGGIGNVSIWASPWACETLEVLCLLATIPRESLRADLSLAVDALRRQLDVACAAMQRVDPSLLAEECPRSVDASGASGAPTWAQQVITSLGSAKRMLPDGVARRCALLYMLGCGQPHPGKDRDAVGCQTTASLWLALDTALSYGSAAGVAAQEDSSGGTTAGTGGASIARWFALVVDVLVPSAPKVSDAEALGDAIYPKLRVALVCLRVLLRAQRPARHANEAAPISSSPLLLRMVDDMDLWNVSQRLLQLVAPFTSPAQATTAMPDFAEWEARLDGEEATDGDVVPLHHLLLSLLVVSLPATIPQSEAVDGLSSRFELRWCRRLVCILTSQWVEEHAGGWGSRSSVLTVSLPRGPAPNCPGSTVLSLSRTLEAFLGPLCSLAYRCRSPSGSFAAASIATKVSEPAPGAVPAAIDARKDDVSYHRTSAEAVVNAALERCIELSCRRVSEGYLPTGEDGASDAAVTLLAQLAWKFPTRIDWAENIATKLPLANPPGRSAVEGQLQRRYQLCLELFGPWPPEKVLALTLGAAASVADPSRQPQPQGLVTLACEALGGGQRHASQLMQRCFAWSVLQHSSTWLATAGTQCDRGGVGSLGVAQVKHGVLLDVIEEAKEGALWSAQQAKAAAHLLHLFLSTSRKERVWHWTTWNLQRAAADLAKSASSGLTSAPDASEGIVTTVVVAAPSSPNRKKTMHICTSDSPQEDLLLFATQLHHILRDRAPWGHEPRQCGETVVMQVQGGSLPARLGTESEPPRSRFLPHPPLVDRDNYTAAHGVPDAPRTDFHRLAKHMRALARGVCSGETVDSGARRIPGAQLTDTFDAALESILERGTVSSECESITRAALQLFLAVHGAVSVTAAVATRLLQLLLVTEVLPEFTVPVRPIRDEVLHVLMTEYAAAVTECVRPAGFRRRGPEEIITANGCHLWSVTMDSAGVSAAALLLLLFDERLEVSDATGAAQSSPSPSHAAVRTTRKAAGTGLIAGWRSMALEGVAASFAAEDTCAAWSVPLVQRVAALLPLHTRHRILQHCAKDASQLVYSSVASASDRAASLLALGSTLALGPGERDSEGENPLVYFRTQVLDALVEHQRRSGASHSADRLEVADKGCLKDLQVFKMIFGHRGCARDILGVTAGDLIGSCGAFLLHVVRSTTAASRSYVEGRRHATGRHRGGRETREPLTVDEATPVPRIAPAAVVWQSLLRNVLHFTDVILASRVSADLPRAGADSPSHRFTELTLALLQEAAVLMIASGARGAWGDALTISTRGELVGCCRIAPPCRGADPVALQYETQIHYLVLRYLGLQCRAGDIPLSALRSTAMRAAHAQLQKLGLPCADGVRLSVPSSVATPMKQLAVLRSWLMSTVAHPDSTWEDAVDTLRVVEGMVPLLLETDRQFQIRVGKRRPHVTPPLPGTLDDAGGQLIEKAWADLRLEFIHKYALRLSKGGGVGVREVQAKERIAMPHEALLYFLESCGHQPDRVTLSLATAAANVVVPGSVAEVLVALRSTPIATGCPAESSPQNASTIRDVIAQYRESRSVQPSRQLVTALRSGMHDNAAAIARATPSALADDSVAEAIASMRARGEVATVVSFVCSLVNPPLGHAPASRVSSGGAEDFSGVLGDDVFDKIEPTHEDASALRYLSSRGLRECLASFVAVAERERRDTSNLVRSGVLVLCAYLSSAGLPATEPGAIEGGTDIEHAALLWIAKYCFEEPSLAVSCAFAYPNRGELHRANLLSESEVQRCAESLAQALEPQLELSQSSKGPLHRLLANTSAVTIIVRLLSTWCPKAVHLCCERWRDAHKHLEGEATASLTQSASSKLASAMLSTSVYNEGFWAYSQRWLPKDILTGRVSVAHVVHERDVQLFSPETLGCPLSEATTGAPDRIKCTKWLSALACFHVATSRIGLTGVGASHLKRLVDLLGRSKSAAALTRGSLYLSCEASARTGSGVERPMEPFFVADETLAYTFFSALSNAGADREEVRYDDAPHRRLCTTGVAAAWVSAYTTAARRRQAVKHPQLTQLEQKPGIAPVVHTASMACALLGCANPALPECPPGQTVRTMGALANAANEWWEQVEILVRDAFSPHCRDKATLLGMLDCAARGARALTSAAAVAVGRTQSEASLGLPRAQWQCSLQVSRTLSHLWFRVFCLAVDCFPRDLFLHRSAASDGARQLECLLAVATLYPDNLSTLQGLTALSRGEQHADPGRPLASPTEPGCQVYPDAVGSGPIAELRACLAEAICEAVEAGRIAVNDEERCLSEVLGGIPRPIPTHAVVFRALCQYAVGRRLLSLSRDVQAVVRIYCIQWHRGEWKPLFEWITGCNPMLSSSRPATLPAAEEEEARVALSRALELVRRQLPRTTGASHAGPRRGDRGRVPRQLCDAAQWAQAFALCQGQRERGVRLSQRHFEQLIVHLQGGRSAGVRDNANGGDDCAPHHRLAAPQAEHGNGPLVLALLRAMLEDGVVPSMLTVDASLSVLRGGGYHTEVMEYVRILALLPPITVRRHKSGSPTRSLPLSNTAPPDPPSFTISDTVLEAVGDSMACVLCPSSPWTSTERETCIENATSFIVWLASFSRLRRFTARTAIGHIVAGVSGLRWRRSTPVGADGARCDGGSPAERANMECLWGEEHARLAVGALRRATGEAGAWIDKLARCSTSRYSEAVAYGIAASVALAGLKEAQGDVTAATREESKYARCRASLAFLLKLHTLHHEWLVPEEVLAALFRELLSASTLSVEHGRVSLHAATTRQPRGPRFGRPPEDAAREARSGRGRIEYVQQVLARIGRAQSTSRSLRAALAMAVAEQHVVAGTPPEDGVSCSSRGGGPCSLAAQPVCWSLAATVETMEQVFVDTLVSLSARETVIVNDMLIRAAEEPHAARWDGDRSLTSVLEGASTRRDEGPRPSAYVTDLSHAPYSDTRDIQERRNEVSPGSEVAWLPAQQMFDGIVRRMCMERDARAAAATIATEWERMGARSREAPSTEADLTLPFLTMLRILLRARRWRTCLAYLSAIVRPSCLGLRGYMTRESAGPNRADRPRRVDGGATLTVAPVSEWSVYTGDRVLSDDEERGTAVLPAGDQSTHSDGQHGVELFLARHVAMHPLLCHIALRAVEEGLRSTSVEDVEMTLRSLQLFDPDGAASVCTPSLVKDDQRRRILARLFAQFHFDSPTLSTLAVLGEAVVS